ncbi:MAG: hypothetical protein AAGF28_04490 [Pseudomonadota bacterium]
MLYEPSENLDALIREEKHRVAAEFFQEAWNNAVQEGIEPAILARSAVEFALTQLGISDGATAVADLIADLPADEETGRFIANKVIQ